MQCVRILRDLSKASVQYQQDSVDEAKSLTVCSKKSDVSGEERRDSWVMKLGPFKTLYDFGEVKLNDWQE